MEVQRHGTGEEPERLSESRLRTLRLRTLKVVTLLDLLKKKHVGLLSGVSSSRFGINRDGRDNPGGTKEVVG